MSPLSFYSQFLTQIHSVLGQHEFGTDVFETYSLLLQWQEVRKRLNDSATQAVLLKATPILKKQIIFQATQDTGSDVAALKDTKVQQCSECGEFYSGMSDGICACPACGAVIESEVPVVLAPVPAPPIVPVQTPTQVQASPPVSIQTAVHAAVQALVVPPPAESVVAPPVKRGRGRPPKGVIPVSSATTLASAPPSVPAAGGTEPVKRRGAARKAEPIDTVTPMLPMMQMLDQDLGAKEKQYAPYIPETLPQYGIDTGMLYWSDNFTCDNPECGRDNLLIRIPTPDNKGQVEVTYCCMDCQHRGIMTVAEADAVYEMGHARLAQLSEVKAYVDRKKEIKKKVEVKESVENTRALGNELDTAEAPEHIKKAINVAFNAEVPCVNRTAMSREFYNMILGWDFEHTVKEWERVMGKCYDGLLKHEVLASELAAQYAGTGVLIS